MQETIYGKEDKTNTTAKGIGDYFSKITGETWHAAADTWGRLVLSRYPILWSSGIRGARGMAALIDLPDAMGSNLLVINLHFFTKPKEVQIKQASRALDFIDAVRQDEYPDIPKNTPIMICGDFNSIPSARPYNILAKLDKKAEEGDGKVTQFITPRPQQLGTEAMGTFGQVTWSGDVGKSACETPSKAIDHILIPKDFMEIQQAFIFNSLILSDKDLAQYGVDREAILLYRKDHVEKVDHLPVFIDLK
jgi:endonuclease/exonuclease/phosphatase family metal-dependent hydrolase